MGDGEVRIFEAVSMADFVEASELYRQAFAYSDKNLSLNGHLMAAIVNNGGVAVGARAGSGSLVAFAYGFPGIDGGATYLYSQATVVAPAAQGLGLGRRLKEAQRRVALTRGYDRMRWAFDPVLSRNAHFNLSVLGARGHHLVMDYYGTGSSDRLIVEWDLDPDGPGRPSRRPGLPPAPESLRSAEPGTTQIVAEAAFVVLHTDPPAGPRSAGHRGAVCASLDTLLRRGFRAVACDIIGEGRSAYVLYREETT